jgi:hypothetical protein
MTAFVAFGLKDAYKTKILILLTTLGLYFIETSSKCTKCPKQDLCFGVPHVLARIAISSIHSIVEFDFLSN